MGEAKNKRQRFLAEHPFCCFCGGEEPATTIDHVPARTCFPDRHPPESFEFPACAECQSATRLDELVFGFYVKLADPDDDNYREGELMKALNGLRNNLPHLMPSLNLSPREKRRSLKDLGLRKPPSQLAADLPLAAVPSEVHEHLLRYARKMACAIYYREQGRPASKRHHVWATWTQGSNRRGIDSLDAFIAMTPLIVRGSRRNIDFGDRFGYRCNKANDPDLLAALAQFGGGIILAMIVVGPDSKERMKDHEGWVSVREMFAR